jgi:hypothetical protein
MESLAPSSDWQPNPEHKLNKALQKEEPKEFLAQWAKTSAEMKDKTLYLQTLLKFLKIGRQKKMTCFTESTMQLAQAYQD